MRDKITVRWEVSDGYVGKSRPQETTIYLDDFEEEMDDDDISEAIHDMVQEDFENRIAWEITGDLDKTVSDIREALKNRED